MLGRMLLISKHGDANEMMMSGRGVEQDPATSFWSPVLVTQVIKRLQAMTDGLQRVVYHVTLRSPKEKNIM